MDWSRPLKGAERILGWRRHLGVVTQLGWRKEILVNTHDHILIIPSTLIRTWTFFIENHHILFEDQSRTSLV
jgi:hypothetical protein